ncbi:glycine cleavage system aminomethyltransferase GcvT [bacterium]|nr:glycine cleavage system aminomethyltransferase GcvT [bacterium]
MSDETLLQTVFHDWHVARGGRMVEFGGWHMPVQYSTIVDEHNAVRNAVGVFDVAHMGRLQFDGPDACRFLDHLLTNDVTKLQPGQVRYSLVTNEAGGILDDVLVYRLDGGYMLVVNASNREKIVAWLEAHRSGFGVQMTDRTLTHPMLALQGPRSVELIRALGCEQAAAMKYYSVAPAIVAGLDVLLSRTGYTGEDGFEVIVETDAALSLLGKVCQAGESLGLQPAGLGCRDTLRLEAAMPLYGHELNEQIDPLSAGLGFAVKLDAGDFIGRDALLAVRDSVTTRVRVGLKLDGRRIAREGATVVIGDEIIGEVTSGTFSPTLEESIAMAYVDRRYSDTGIALEVDIRGKRIAARTVDLPFYRRPKSN